MNRQGAEDAKREGLGAETNRRGAEDAKREGLGAETNRRGAEDAKRENQSRQGAEDAKREGLGAETNRRGAEDAKREGLSEPGAELDLLTQGVIGAAIEVHRVLGPGFLESVYEKALAFELELRGIPYANQVPVAVEYKRRPVGEGCADFIVGSSLLVELKAVEVIAPIHVAQVLSYLKATGLRLGLLITFNVDVLRRGVRRVIRSP